MISHAKISRHRRMFKTLTGLSTEGFKQILPSFEEAWEADLDRRGAGRLRLRGRGGGRKGGFRGSADRLVFILVYFRLYPIQAVQGLLFGMSQPQANEWVHRLTPFLNAALGHQQQLPARQPRDLEAVLGECEGLEFIIDGVERPIQRPKNPERQRQFYSGKKKRHSIKNNLIIERRTRKIKGLSTTCEGKKHDKKLADEQALRFPKGSKLWKDTGFQGYEPEGVTTLQAKKKPKGGKLSPEEKEANRRVSKLRVRVEHSSAGVKVFRSVRDIYRNFKAGFEDTLIETACGLHNLRSDFPIEAWLKAA